MTYAIPGPWTEHAACRGATAAMALPIGEAASKRRLRQGKARIYRPRPNPHLDNARAICHSCPVLEQCRAWALTSPDPAAWLVAGGMTPAERDDARTGRARNVS